MFLIGLLTFLYGRYGCDWCVLKWAIPRFWAISNRV